MTIGKCIENSIYTKDENANLDCKKNVLKIFTIKNENSEGCAKNEYQNKYQNLLYQDTKLTGRGHVLIISLAGTIFAGCASYSLIAPFFPRVAETKGLNISEYSLIFAVYEMGRFFLPPICSKLAIRMTPKIFLMTGLFVIAFCCTLFGFLIYAKGGKEFLILCLIVRCFWSFGGSAVTTTANLLGTILFPKHIGTIFAAIEIGAGVGVVAGPFFGGMLYELAGFPMPFICTSIFCILSMIPVYFLVQNEIKPKDKSKPVVPTSFLQAMKVPGVWANLTFVAVTSLAIGWNEASLEYHLREIGDYTPSQVGYIFLISGLIYSFVAYAVGQVANRWPKCYLLNFIGLILLTCCWLIVGPLPYLPLEPSLALVNTSQAFFGIGTAFLFVLSFDDMIKEAKKNLPDNESTMAVISGLYTSSYALGVSVGPLAAGQLIERYGYRNATIPMVIVMSSLILVAMVYYFKLKKDTTNEAQFKDDKFKDVQFKDVQCKDAQLKDVLFAGVQFKDGKFKDIPL